MRIITIIIAFIYSILISVLSNGLPLINYDLRILVIYIAVFLWINVFSGYFVFRTHDKKLKSTYRGTVLLMSFLVSSLISVCFEIYAVINSFASALSIIFCILIEAIVFWNGIITVYLNSKQLGIKNRLFGILVGMVPLINIFTLKNIIKTTFDEVHFEYSKELINIQRSSQFVCKTKYPILFVHGVFFRDSEYFNYWGRIPQELEKNGAEIFYGNHHSASSVADSGKELAKRITEIVKDSGCKKLNIIAHSKGGLDCRYALAELGVSEYVVSLTTVNTPHNGCEFADYLLNTIDNGIKNKIATTYNSTLKILGEKNPDFLSAVTDLTATSCKEFNNKYPKTQCGVFCQSIGSIQKGMSGGKFPLNLSYLLVKYFNGANDGLVSETSFKWGERYTLLEAKAKRGISHGDMIDLNRENIAGFDVREFYVNLVNDLKCRGF